jgi:Holliday junction resolvase RusA-like endonuclease
MTSIAFFAAGSPSTKGSARAFIRGGRAIITNDAGERAKSWAAIVGWAAREAMKGAAPFPGAVRVSTAFYLARPKSHYRSNGQLKPGAPTHAATKPDGDKLTRCTWDALTGIVFVDDSRIVAWSGEKPYSNDGRTGAQIVIEPVGLP